jgi:hypothetical protein
MAPSTYVDKHDSQIQMNNTGTKICEYNGIMGKITIDYLGSI